MKPDRTFTYGGALVIGIIMGVGLGARMESVAGGVLVGVLAAAAWLAAAHLWRDHKA